MRVGERVSRSGVRTRAGTPVESGTVEWRLARAAAAAVLVVSAPTIAVAALVAGRPGAIGAAIAAAVVLGMFVLSGGLVAFGARFGPNGIFAATLGGFFLRLVLYAALIVMLSPLPGIDGPSLAVSAAVLLVTSLAWEVRYVMRTPEFFWLDTARTGRARAGAERMTP